MNINDAKYAALGGVGDINDLYLAWLQAGGATANQINDAEYEYLIAQGATPGHVNDMWMEILPGPGSLNDRLLEFWLGGGGGATPPPVRDYTLHIDLNDESTLFTDDKGLIPSTGGVGEQIKSFAEKSGLGTLCVLSGGSVFNRVAVNSAIGLANNSGTTAAWVSTTEVALGALVDPQECSIFVCAISPIGNLGQDAWYIDKDSSRIRASIPFVGGAEPTSYWDCGTGLTRISWNSLANAGNLNIIDLHKNLAGVQDAYTNGVLSKAVTGQFNPIDPLVSDLLRGTIGGTLCEIITYARRVTAEEATATRAYLNAKWGGASGGRIGDPVVTASKEYMDGEGWNTEWLNGGQVYMIVREEATGPAGFVITQELISGCDYSSLPSPMANDLCDFSKGEGICSSC